MKKKLFLTFLMVAVLTVILAIGISATTYNYYENEAVESNKLYTIEASFGSKNTRFEMISKAEGVGFARVDENGTPLTWYVVADDLGKAQSGVRNIIVKSTPTIGGVVGDVDENGNYTYGIDVDGISYSKKVVSVNFFGTQVKTLPEQAYMATYSLHTPGQKYQYCQIADGSYILALYLPKTLTGIPKQLCFRSPVIVLEFEDNQVTYNNFGVGVTGFDAGYPNEIAYPFSFCANLKSLTIPEGITTMPTHTFRECLSLAYLKFPSTMTRLEPNVFFHSISFETVIYGENMTYTGVLNSDYKKVYSDWGINNFNIKYIYVPNSISEANSFFDTYRGQEKNYININKNLVFFFAGFLSEAKAISGLTDKHFKAACNNAVDYQTYLSNKEYYDTKISGHLLVYGLTDCEAFYNGEHLNTDSLVYKDAVSPIVKTLGCTRCNSATVEEFAPVIEPLGYSAQIGGDLICLGYLVNNESLAYCPEGFEYGVLATVPAAGADMSAYEPLNPDLTPAVENKVALSVVEKEVGAFEIIISSFSKDSAYYDIEFVMCAFVTDGEKVDYLCFNELNEIVQVPYASTVTFNYIAEECTPKYAVTFAVKDEAMGTISGEAYQVVKEGAESASVTAVAKEGYEFVAWSDGTKTPSVTVTATKTTDLVAYFTPKSTGLPVITINTELGTAITTKDYYINCEITINDTTDEELDRKDTSIVGQAAEIKGRGNSTWKYDKKPYKFKFESKQNLFGYGKEKTWVLLADARDYSLVRNMIALNTALSMSELQYTSKGQSVELYLNGEYQGVYYLCEQIQVKGNRVAIEEDGELDENGNIKPESLGYLIEMDAWAADGSNQSGIANYTKDGDVFVKVNGAQQPFVIKDPEDVFYSEDENGNEYFDAEKAKPYLDYIQGYLQEVHNAIYANDYAKVCELVDVKSFAQAYIIFELFKNPDTNYSSVYFYKDAGGKLVADPLWDFDMSVGNVTHKNNSLCGSNAVYFRDTEFLWTAAQNYWYKELLEFTEFKELIGQELVENAASIRAAIAENLAYARAHADAYKKNFEKWDLIGNVNAPEAWGNWSVPKEFREFETWEEHLEYIENYLEESLTYLLSYYPAPQAE